MPVAHLLEHAPELYRGYAVEIDREGVQEPRVGRLVVPAVPGYRGHVDGGVLGDRRLHEGGDALQIVGDGEPLDDGDIDLLALDELLAGLRAELQSNGVGLAVELAAPLALSPPLLEKAFGKYVPVERQWVAPLPAGLVEHAAAHGDVSLSFALPIGPLLLFRKLLLGHPKSPSPGGVLYGTYIINRFIVHLETFEKATIRIASKAPPPGGVLYGTVANDFGGRLPKPFYPTQNKQHFRISLQKDSNPCICHKDLPSRKGKHLWTEGHS